jgi:hypothetical protein
METQPYVAAPSGCPSNDLIGAQVERRFGYKAFQVFFMAHILQYATSNVSGLLTSDLLYFMNAKVAHRLAKMGSCVEGIENDALQFASNTVKDTSRILKQRREQNITEWEGREQWTPPAPAAFNNCLTLSLKNGQKHLQQVVNRRHQLDKMVNTFDKAAMERDLRSPCVTRLSYGPENQKLPPEIFRQEENISLYDFESWV